MTEPHATTEPPEARDSRAGGGPMAGWERILARGAAVVDGINERLGMLSKYLVVMALLVGFGNVVLRYVGRQLGRSLASNTYIELQWYLYGTLFLLAFAAVLRRGVNVRVDFWYADLPRRRQLLIDLVGHFVALLPFTILGWYIAFPRVMTSFGRRPSGEWPSGWRVWETWEVSADAGGLPRAPIKAMILVGFVMLTAQAIAEIVKIVLALRGHEDEVDLAAGMVGAVKIE